MIFRIVATKSVFRIDDQRVFCSCWFRHGWRRQCAVGLARRQGHASPFNRRALDRGPHRRHAAMSIHGSDHCTKASVCSRNYHASSNTFSSSSFGLLRCTTVTASQLRVCVDQRAGFASRAAS